MLEVFAPIRDHYLACYKKSIADAKREVQRVVPELPIEPNGSMEPEALFKLIRVDIIGMDGDKHVIREVVLDTSPLPSGLTGFDCPISLSAAAWHGMEFEVTAPDLPEAQLLTWTEKWLDPEDLRPEDELGLQGVIHNMRRPTVSEIGYHLAVDFGSAPLEALDELLAVLCANHASSIRVGSFELETTGEGAVGA